LDEQRPQFPRTWTQHRRRRRRTASDGKCSENRNGAHYCFDPVTFDGLVFPTLRRIIAQQGINSLFKAHTGVMIDIADVRIAR
jgi:hypothetical protein